jgi:Fe-S cluster biogenesis protein NfuA
MPEPPQTTDLTARVESLLDELRPMLRADGGEVDLVAVHAGPGRVELRFRGACSHCPASSYTLEFSLRRRLIEALPEVREVVAV